MMGLVARLLGRTEARMAEANERDAAAIAAVHAESFQRGWGEDEVRSLLLDRNIAPRHSEFAASLPSGRH